MTTIVTKSIGASGRDYSTLQAWEDDCPPDLVSADQVWRGEMYNDAEFTDPLTIAGITTDATRYIELTVAAGQSWIDDANVRTDPLTYNQSRGVGHRRSNARSIRLQARSKISRLQMFEGGSHNGMCLEVSDVNANNSIVEDCLLIRTATNQGAPYAFGSGVKTINCILVGNGLGSGAFTNGAEFHYCTIARPLNQAASGDAIGTGPHSSGNKVFNCLILNFANALAASSVSRFSNFDYCVTDAAVPATASNTGSIGGVIAANQIESGDGSSGYTLLDLRTKATADAVGVGNPAISGSPSDDITGVLRGNPSTAGAWEISAGGGTPYTVELTAASFGLTPRAPQPRLTSTTSPAAFSFTPNAVTTNIGKLLELTAAAFSFVARAFQLKLIPGLTAAAFSFAGRAVSLLSSAGTLIDLTTAAFSYTARSVQLSFLTALSLASVAFSPLAVGVRQVMALGAGAFSFVGRAVQPKIAMLLTAASVAFSPFAFAVRTAMTLTAAAFSLTGQGVGALYSTLIELTAAGFRMVGQGLRGLGDLFRGTFWLKRLGRSRVPFRRRR